MQNVDGMTHARAVMLMIAANILWSTAGLVTRLLEQPQSWEVAFWRSFFAAFSMAGILVWTRRRAAWAAVRAVGGAGILSGLMFCTMFTCFMLAVTRTTVANTLVVNSLYPVFAAILGWLVLGMRLPGYTWFAILAAVGGMSWMFASGLGPGLSGTLIAFAIPVAAAINVIALRKWGRAVDLAPAVLLGALFSALLTLPFALPFQATAHDLTWLAALGMFQLAVPCMMLVSASRYLPPAEVALLTLLEAVLGPLWAWFGVGEQPGAATLTGGGIVLLAIASNELFALYGPARFRRVRSVP
jgi:drug/metabolite transporter (DMT)-like permease